MEDRDYSVMVQITEQLYKETMGPIRFTPLSLEMPLGYRVELSDGTEVIIEISAQDNAEYSVALDKDGRKICFDNNDINAENHLKYGWKHILRHLHKEGSR